jgi:uncharacterized protein with PQ loop repeat
MSLPVFDAPAGSKVAWFAFTVNVGLYCSQLPLMRVMIADADPISLARYSVIPSLLQAITTSMWIGYGSLAINSSQLLACNAIGIVLALIYVSVFVMKKPARRDKLIAAAGYIAAVGFALVVYGVLYSSAYAERDKVAGAFTTAITILFWMSPLAALREAFIARDDKRVPVPMTLTMILNNAAWLSVGVLIGDLPLIICNAVGVAVCILQLIIIVSLKLRRRRAVQSGLGDLRELSQKGAESGTGGLL